MVKVSYSALYGIRHERDHHEDIHAGDLVRTGANARPLFEVVAVDGERAWVRNADNRVDGIVELNRCRKVERSPQT
jgi:hypothetical protein